MFCSIVPPFFRTKMSSTGWFNAFPPPGSFGGFPPNPWKFEISVPFAFLILVGEVEKPKIHWSWCLCLYPTFRCMGFPPLWSTMAWTDVNLSAISGGGSFCLAVGRPEVCVPVVLSKLWPILKGVLKHIHSVSSRAKKATHSCYTRDTFFLANDPTRTFCSLVGLRELKLGFRISTRILIPLLRRDWGLPPIFFPRGPLAQNLRSRSASDANDSSAVGAAHRVSFSG